MVMFYSENDVFYNEKGVEEDIILLHQIIKHQLINISGYFILPININKWNTLSLDKQKNMLNPIVKGYKYT